MTSRSLADAEERLGEPAQRFEALGDPPSPLFSRRRLPLLVTVVVAWSIWGGVNVLRMAGIPNLGWSEAFWYGFPDALIWAALTPLVVAFARRHPIERRRWLHSLSLHLAAAIGFALVHSAVDASVASLRAWLGFGEAPWLLVFLKVLGYGLQMNVLVYTLVAGLALYIDHERRLSRIAQRTADLRTELMKARLSGLERQLRPHFLFNALNTVSGLIGGDPEPGRRVVRRLGELLRAGLRSQPGQRIPLAEELDLAAAYLDIEQIRFGDRLKVTVEVEPNHAERREQTLAFPVPALVLQPLVENAVTHGIAKGEDGGSIRVIAEGRGAALVLSVEDDGPGPQAPAEEASGFGIGLGGTRERLRALYGDETSASVRLEPLSVDPCRGTRVRLVLPAQPAEAL